MRDDKEGAVAKLLADTALDEHVGGHVDGRGGFVEDHDLGARDDGAREAEELALALRQVEAAFANFGGERLENVGIGIDGRWSGGAASVDQLVAAHEAGPADEVDPLQSIEEFSICVLVECVKVRANGAGEEDRILGNNSQTTPQVVQSDFGDIDPIDDNTAFACFEEAEQGQCKGRFPSTRPSDDSHSLILLGSKRQAFENRR